MQRGEKHNIPLHILEENEPTVAAGAAAAENEESCTNTMGKSTINFQRKKCRENISN